MVTLSPESLNTDWHEALPKIIEALTPIINLFVTHPAGTFVFGLVILVWALSLSAIFATYLYIRYIGLPKEIKLKGDTKTKRQRRAVIKPTRDKDIPEK